MTAARSWAAYLAAAAVVVLAYLLTARSAGLAGFPLDDAWIHQVYARSWAVSGEWAFQPGEPSAGSTAPLWSALMAGGPLLGIDPVAWSAIVGVLTLAALGALGASAIRRLVPERPGWAFWGGLLLVLEWHLAWAALSGMETLLSALVAAFVLVELSARRLKPVWLGVLVGLGLWLRPDALLLGGPVVLVLWLEASGARGRLSNLIGFVTGFAALALPYLALNVSLSGTVWPTTYFAKQAEYAGLRGLPFPGRLASQLAVPVIGVGALLAPWLALELRHAWARRRWGRLAAAAWILLMAGLYALRLPVTYQHGRYMIPAIPIFLLLGFAGLARFVRLRDRAFRPRVLGRTAVLATGAVCLAFLAIGARTYAQDVGVIETEMVAAARWIAANSEAGALVAAHDIGALGYYGDRRIVDLAGLVSPEVVPILRDEPALAALMRARGVDLFMTLRGWYPGIEAGLPVVFETGAAYSPALGGANMVVYRFDGDS